MSDDDDEEEEGSPRAISKALIAEIEDDTDPEKVKGLNNACYTISEGYGWPDDVTVSPEQAVRCYQLVKWLKEKGRLPNKFIL